ncbi:MAG: hypothetical protein AB7U92_25110 [Piscinibacter sp.]|uniref:hypothetical protein n=1 Tax=Piscinibacter sp. TaxID=1903157 RepID=UPI003D0B9C89
MINDAALAGLCMVYLLLGLIVLALLDDRMGFPKLMTSSLVLFVLMWALWPLAAAGWGCAWLGLSLRRRRRAAGW